MSDPVVKVEEGKLKGKVNKTLNNFEYFAFKSVPYAKPPVGELRFSVPVPPEPWEGVRDATKNCNICAQLDRATQSVVGDEDCLYLNVYSPKLPASDDSLLPVMVFIHGGGFVFGSGTDDTVHGPDFLIEKDVVVVTFNYRLGILGFLALNSKDAPGNMGLRDQVQALKWIQKNIKQFGGDPNNVTIFGVSAGGASVEYLLLSPMAKGLFHKAIAQSGSTLLPWAQSSKIKKMAHKIRLITGNIVTSDEKLLKFLKGLSTKDLITYSMVVLAAEAWDGGITFGFVPTVEKSADWETFLDKKPYDALASGEFTKVPFISGFCSREGLLMVSHHPARLEKLKKEKNFLDFLPFDIDETEKQAMETKFKTIYLEAEQKFDDEDAFAIDYFTDVDFFGGGYVSASLIAKNNSPVYFYEFAYDGALNYLKKKYNIPRKGACHGDEGGYIIKSSILDGEISKTDEIVKNRLVGMWTNFAKYGDPTPEVNELLPTKWEPIAETGLAYLYIDEELKMKEDLYPARVKLFKELYEKYNLSS
ncbi:esterase FE4-like [Ostrinia furnacalis]|uniref:esterase FE4-like n=1 Tax=Ostrinia furnacalis TaxID=93504 RepID=UPI00103C54FA|nr:esterase FE4-like [Ostrinia furnacalis]